VSGTAAAAPTAARIRERGNDMAKCPECESDLELDGYELDVGESINCPECSIELKVTGNDPVSVSVAPEE
jgi:lysine biosynthesis protein LysW